MQETDAILGCLAEATVICTIIIAASNVSWDRAIACAGGSIPSSVLGSAILISIGRIPVLLLRGNYYRDGGKELGFNHKGANVARGDEPVNDLKLLSRSNGGQLIL